MKSNKAIRILTIVVIILLLSCVSFFGILRHNMNDWENILPEYSLSRDLTGIRVFSFNVDESTKEVDVDSDDSEEDSTDEESTEEAVDDSVEVDQTVTSEGETLESTDTTTQQESEDTDTSSEEETTQEVPVNDESVLTADNYKKSKSIIQKRFKAMGITDYSIRLNQENGKIQVEVPYDETSDTAIDLIINQGKIEIVDSDTDEVLMDNSYIKSVTAYYTQSSSTSTTDTTSNALDLGIQLDFNKQGLEKLGEISKTYVETIDEEGESEIKSITIRIDDEDKYKTYFSVDGNYTYLAIPLYQSVSDDELINEYYKQCVMLQNSINGGKLPIVYTLDTGSYIEKDSKIDLIKTTIIIFIIVVAVIGIALILKYKKAGVYSLLLQIGYIATLLLLIRFAGVTLTLTGLIAILASILLNYYFILLMIRKEENRYLSAAGRFLLNTIPLIIFMIVFNFSNTIQLKSIGMVLFWGFLVTLIYNLIFSKYLLDCCDKEKEKGAEK